MRIPRPLLPLAVAILVTLPGIAVALAQVHLSAPLMTIPAAQSLLAVVMLATLRLSAGQALLLLGLFAGQLIAPGVVEALPGGRVMGLHGEQMHPLFTCLYLVAVLSAVVHQPRRLLGLGPWARSRSQHAAGNLCAACGSPVESLIAPCRSPQTHSRPGAQTSPGPTDRRGDPT